MAAWYAADDRGPPWNRMFCGSVRETGGSPMIKALLTPVILGLAVAMVIRVAMARRA